MDYSQNPSSEGQERVWQAALADLRRVKTLCEQPNARIKITGTNHMGTPINRIVNPRTVTLRETANPQINSNPYFSIKDIDHPQQRGLYFQIGEHVDLSFELVRDT